MLPQVRLLPGAEQRHSLIQLQNAAQRVFRHRRAVDAAGVAQPDAVCPDIIQRHVINAVGRGVDIFQLRETRDVVGAEKTVAYHGVDVGEIQVIGLLLCTGLSVFSGEKDELETERAERVELFRREAAAVRHQNPHGKIRHAAYTALRVSAICMA